MIRGCEVAKGHYMIVEDGEIEAVQIEGLGIECTAVRLRRCFSVVAQPRRLIPPARKRNDGSRLLSHVRVATRAGAYGPHGRQPQGFRAL